MYLTLGKADAYIILYHNSLSNMDGHHWCHTATAPLCDSG